MSAKQMSLAWEKRYIRPVTKLVLLALADNAGDEGVVWIGVNHIASRAGIDSAKCLAIYAELEVLGWLSPVPGTLGEVVLTLEPEDEQQSHE